MKNLRKALVMMAAPLILWSCSDRNDPVVSDNVNDMTLHFDNTFKNNSIVLGGANDGKATVNTSEKGQKHHFSELKYVISNIRLITTDNKEVPYYIDDLDNGAWVIDQSKAASLDVLLKDIPAGDYKQIKFGFGVKTELNTLDQEKFPKFYELTGANNSEMHWEWGTGYRFAKIEGFYDDAKQLSIHMGSTVKDGDDGDLVQGVDAYREIVLDMMASVGKTAPKVTIKADFDKLLSGDEKILITDVGFDQNATPSIHTADQMLRYVNNLVGKEDGSSTAITFSIGTIK